MFTYFSPDVNDNLSSFVGPFIAGKAGKVAVAEFETPDTFLLVPRPSAPPLSNFTLAPLKSWLFRVTFDNSKESKITELLSYLPTSTTHALDESVAGLNLAGFKETR